MRSQENNILFQPLSRWYKHKKRQKTIVILFLDFLYFKSYNAWCWLYYISYLILKKLFLVVDHTYEFTSDMMILHLTDWTYAQIYFWFSWIPCNCLRSSFWRSIFQRICLLKTISPVPSLHMERFSYLVIN